MEEIWPILGGEELGRGWGGGGWLYRGRVRGSEGEEGGGQQHLSDLRTSETGPS